MEKDSEKGAINIALQINANTIEQIVSGVETVTSYFGADNESAVRKQTSENTGKSNPLEHRDITVIRTEILEYVSRVCPLLTDEAKSTFMKMWDDILSLPEVESLIYNPGHQYGTNFNRDLVCNILYHLRTRKIYAEVYRNDINSAALAFALERNKEHSIKHALRAEPPQNISDAVDRLLKQKY